MTARPFHLDKRNGKLMGVCAGLADHADIDVTLVRIAVVLLTVAVLGPVMLVAYLLAGLIASERPA